MRAVYVARLQENGGVFFVGTWKEINTLSKIVSCSSPSSEKFSLSRQSVLLLFGDKIGILTSAHYSDWGGREKKNQAFKRA